MFSEGSLVTYENEGIFPDFTDSSILTKRVADEKFYQISGGVKL